MYDCIFSRRKLSGEVTTVSHETAFTFDLCTKIIPNKIVILAKTILIDITSPRIIAPNITATGGFIYA